MRKRPARWRAHCAGTLRKETFGSLTLAGGDADCLAICQGAGVTGDDYFLAAKVFPLDLFTCLCRLPLLREDFDQFAAAQAHLDRRTDCFAVLHAVAERLLTLGHNGCYRQGPDILMFRDNRGGHV